MDIKDFYDHEKTFINKILARKKPVFQSQKKFQATLTSDIEGSYRRILNIPSLLEMVNTSEYANRYTTYDSQITGIYQKCQAITPYGAPLTADLIEKRVNLILSDGINIDAPKKSTYKWIDNWFRKNKLYGSKILKFIRTYEKEGRNLSILIPKKQGTDKSKWYVELKTKIYYYNRYTIKINDNDEEVIDKIIFKDAEGKEIIYAPDKFVYIHNGDRLDKDPQICVGSILTQCDNIDRALYDLRKSNHIFGFPTPAFEAQDIQSVNKIKEAIAAREWEIGDTFVGQSKMYYPNPPDSAQTIKEEISLNTKIISSRTGIPPHWIAWVDLMSNRATALELRDQINLSVKDEKTVICEGIEEAIKKAMVLSIDNGIDAEYDEEFSVSIPDISVETIKQLSETFLPLMQAEVISMSDMRNKIPGIDEAATAREIEKQKKENMANFQKNIEDMKYNEKMEKGVDDASRQSAEPFKN